MIAEGKDHGLAINLFGQFHCPADNALMADMHAIKHAERYRQAGIFFC